MTKNGIAIIIPLTTLRNSFDPTLLFSGIIFLHFSINLFASGKDFTKKESGKVMYLAKLKFRILPLKNKVKNKNSRYKLP